MVLFFEKLPQQTEVNFLKGHLETEFSLSGVPSMMGLNQFQNILFVVKQGTK